MNYLYILFSLIGFVVGCALCYVVLYPEICALKRQLEDASHDHLTGLIRRERFEEHVTEAIAYARRSETSCSLLMIDINNLKPVNDTHGHPEGDKLIASFARVLRESLRDCDIVARMGGDEFAVLLPGENKRHAIITKKRILLRLQSASEQIPYFNGAAIGVATYWRDGETLEDLYVVADAALYKHKEEMKKGK